MSAIFYTIMSQVILGAVLVGAGFLSGRYPNMISGISTMPKHKRDNVDLPAMGRLCKRALILMGATSTIVGTILALCNLQSAIVVSNVAITLFGCFALSIAAQKYDHNKKTAREKVVPILIIVAIAIFVVGLFVTNSGSTKVEITPQEVEFDCSYGITIQRKDITKVEVLSQIPRILMRTGGFSDGTVRRGAFNLQDIGRCRLYLETTKAPYLYIELDDGRKIIYNTESTNKVDSLYKVLRPNS